MDNSKTDSQQRNRLINKLILIISFDECSLNRDNYDTIVPEFVKMYHELAAIHHRTITREDYKTSIIAFVQDLAFDELNKWVESI